MKAKTRRMLTILIVGQVLIDILFLTGSWVQFGLNRTVAEILQQYVLNRPM